MTDDRPPRSFTTTILHSDRTAPIEHGSLHKPLHLSVAYAGLAPGYTGLYQLNVQVPSTTQSGAVRVFIVMPSGFSSQNGVVLYVQ